MLALILAAAIIFLLGYTVGRIRPANWLFEWAHWQRWGKKPTGLRYAAAWTLLSAEDIGWLIAHPGHGWDAWKHRNDPPPPRSPAPQIRRLPNHTVDEEA